MQTPTPAAAPQAPASTPNVIVTVPGPNGAPIDIPAPRTARDIEALKARREELSNQLQSVDSRRSKLISQLKQTGDPTAIKGLESRLALLDARQLQLESDIQQTGQQLTSPSAGLLASAGAAQVFGGLSSGQVMGLSVLSIIFILSPLAVGLGRAIFKRSARPGPPPAVFTETAQRLERLEASVDAIAIEIERVSEGQRFVTKLLSESQPAPMLGAGQRKPESVS
jgi:archaellum component FlaC